MPGKTRTVVVKGPQFPVEVSTGTITYQVREGRGWRSVCTLGAEAARKTISLMTERKRKQGTDYRFTASR